MSITRTAIPLLLVSTLLTGCAGLQKTDWPKCAAVGGVGGAALGAIESSSWAGWGALLGGGLAAGYCWAHGDGDEDGDGVPDSRDKCPGTPPGVQVDANGCPPEPAVVEEVEEVVVVEDETIVVRDLLFAFDSAALDPADKAKLDTIASRLRNEAPTAKLTITGHTDSVGSDSYNQKLSEKRAHSVTDYLVSTGIPKGSIAGVSGAGESQPVADNGTADGRALNRRVEILIDR
ncbi:OmpA family protein [Pseudomonas solani]|uniref:OmpA family protein n=1 Tax=Pseudomonas TaxID=286 RepID=UPI0021E06D13|nr:MULTISPECIES: OmpA family protein [unclassified Pseudomonas]MCU9947419.1 OmpA family protein [Pseudomonas sp. PDM13]MDU9415647.1 OmpA family protein [Pseudomonas sp. zfem005]